MHKALYREYRPLVFDDVVGQEHIIKTLKNQINNNNLSHAYLFCGTRGTGKTTTAKILSRAVNCLSNDESHPCNKCEVCTGIMEGSNLDVIEIDAASNNSVDDIRELRETVKYTPSSSSYKVYIIDEVHMLSQGAFNALLKTLEEPPSYVIFILATTEPNKIPATILSRCQRFDFKRVSIDLLIKKMRYICNQENVDIDDDALRIIARNGQGSVRDSLSILDKCVSFSSARLTSGDVLELLGSCDPYQLFDFAESIIDSDVARSMKIIDDYYMWGKDLKILAQDTTMFFRSLMMAKIFGRVDDSMDMTEQYEQQMLELSNEVDMDEIIRLLGILSDLSSNLKYSTNQRITLEIYIMKMSQPSMDSSDEAIIKRIENIERLIEDGKIKITQSLPSVIYQASSPNMIDSIERADYITENKLESEQNLSQRVDIIDDDEIKYINENWKKLLDHLQKDKKIPLRAFLSEKLGLKYKNEILYVIFNAGFTFAIGRLSEGENYQYIKETMRKVFGLNIEPRFILETDISKMEFGEYNNKKEESVGLVDILKDSLGDSLEIED